MGNRLVLALVTAVSLLSFSGCGSIREQMIRGGLPETYKAHSAGLIVNPADADVEAAVRLGKSDKDGMAVEYAHLSQSMGFGTALYVRVKSPLYLIADHSRERAREYKEPDPAFVDFCRKLDAVKLELQEQTSTRNYTQVARRFNVILLRDGVRVEPLSKIPAYSGRDPFFKPDKQMQAILDSYTKNANLSPEAKAAYDSYMGMFSGQGGNRDAITLSEHDGVYSASELNKPGRYEIVFRNPPEVNLFDFDADKERRVVVDFSKLR